MLSKIKASLREKGVATTGQHQSSSLTSQSTHPPPIPYASKPKASDGTPSHTATAYWLPALQPALPLTNEWRRETGAHGWGNQEIQDYTNDDENSYYSTHGLVVKAIVGSDGISSARLTSHETLQRDSGYLAAKISAPSAKGIWPAFWLLPKEPFKWPEDGEIDIMESWNGSPINHSCLHWGHYNGEDWNKHRVVDTPVAELKEGTSHTYGFAWKQDHSQSEGRLVWYIDDRPVMKADIPAGMRRISEFQIKLNIACGGNVMQGIRPADGQYDMIVHEIGMYHDPPRGWVTFEESFLRIAPEGRAM